MLETKVVVEQLTIRGDDNLERRIFSEKGEMVQILNRTHEAFKNLVYWDLNSAKTGQERGHHYHERKIERFYVLTGELELSLKDIETLDIKRLKVKAGDRLIISPRVAHAFRSLRYSQVLEYSPEPYNPTDTYPCKVVI
jgi:mannose-6-phosphate isomerase-like protein (cupin superfamily)